MRILRSIHSVNPAGGGPIEGVIRVSELHRESGHEVEIVSLDDPNASWVLGCPLKVHAFGPGSGSYGYSPRFVPWLRTHASSFDAVIIHGIWQYNSFGVWRTLHKMATPYYVFPHGMLDPWFKRHYPLKHLKKWFYWPWAEYRVLRDAKSVLFTCEEERRLARKSFWLYRCNERVVNYGTADPGGDPEEQKESFYSEFPQLRGKRLILFLGRLHEKKGVDLAIRAFLNHAKHPDMHLVLAGPASAPEYERELRALANNSNCVTFTGMLGSGRKWGAFRAAECFLLPSHQENFGIAVVEALACRVPVIISNQVNIWREIAADGAGLIEEDTLDGTTKLLRRWLALEDEERRRMAAAARSSFEKRFEIHQAAASQLTVFHNGKGSMT